MRIMGKNQFKKKANQALSLIVLLSFTLTACSNQKFSQKISSLTSGLSTTGSSSGKQLVISNVTVNTSSSTPLTTVFFNSSTSQAPIANFCSVSTTATTPSCICEFTWQDTNDITGTAYSINRSAQSAVASVQNYSVTCNAPNAYMTEIQTGTVIKIKVVPGTTASGTFSMSAYNFTKSATQESADFYDASGRAMVNIHRYSCYEKVTKGTTLKSKVLNVTDSSSGNSADVVMATQFCAAKADGSPAGNDNECAGVTQADYSAQSSYANLYIPSYQLGGFTVENNRYACPLVKEPIKSTGALGQQGQPWPRDTTYALSKYPSSTFPVGVEAPSVLGISDDPSTAPTKCFTSGTAGQQPTGGNPNSISTKCLGYAMKPATNGTCPYFKDSQGNTRLTYRLRRFVALFPSSFEATGKTVEQALATDVIYVLDRPINSGDPLKPYTMMGPKPCPFAYYDNAGALGLDPNDGDATSTGNTNLYNGGLPAWVGTNHTSSASTDADGDGLYTDPDWNYKNVDNIHFPNIDDFSSRSCSAAMPVVHYDGTGSPNMVGFATTNPNNLNRTGITNKVNVGQGIDIDLGKIHVRPIERWAPHYVEDTTFQACAPQSDPMVDPPLHFSKDSDGNIAWCAMSYPSQVDAVALIDRKRGGAVNTHPGYVRPFTSPVVKNTTSAACTATTPTIPSTYPAAGGAGCSPANKIVVGAARHPSTLYVDSTSAASHICSNRTCDRTIMNPGSGKFKNIPLVAPPADIEAALRADKNYRCSITYDASSGKEGKSPKDGCCNKNIVNLLTGGVGGTYDHAHLEPDKACGTPDY